MPQLSLYIDKNTLHKLDVAAKIENLSISKFAVKTLNEKLNKGWPENYINVFGSIDDETFIVEKHQSFELDSARESL
ncbi:MAG: toxin-antitoxin system, antitoxin component [Candidatus Marinimicrobia bacterium]|nr:toxin-antitoxin system, antitoxin component [Candidatus Neomarinimicrobiota bacterium]